MLMPNLGSLEVKKILTRFYWVQIFDHICRADRRKKHGENMNLAAWKPSPGFMHHNLKKLSIRRAFNVWKDLRFARLVMELTVNLESRTMGVKSLECEDCIVTGALNLNGTSLRIHGE